MRHIVTSLCLAAVCHGEEIRWTALGSVESLIGSGFSGSGVTVGDEVSVVMSYDSGATLRGISFLPINGAFAGRGHFHGGIDLKIEIRIGDDRWEGLLPTVEYNGGAPTIETLCWDEGGSPDTLTVKLRETEGGTFPAFPFICSDGDRELAIEIADRTTPAELFFIQQLPLTPFVDHPEGRFYKVYEE